jgi:arylsulfatase A-like enzyme
MERMDAEIGALFEVLRTEGRWDETTVILVSDHGFAPFNHLIRTGVLLRALGLSETDARGKTVRWRAQVSTAGGTAGIILHPEATDDDRRKVDDALNLLSANPAYGIRKIFREQASPATGGEPGASAILEAAPGFSFQGGETQGLVSPLEEGRRSAGSHGYDPRRPEMRAAFVMRGPNVIRGKKLGLVRLADVAPTVAKVLGIDMGPGKIEGRVLTEAFAPPGR